MQLYSVKVNYVRFDWQIASPTSEITRTRPRILHQHVPSSSAALSFASGVIDNFIDWDGAVGWSDLSRAVSQLFRIIILRLLQATN